MPTRTADPNPTQTDRLQHRARSVRRWSGGSAHFGPRTASVLIAVAAISYGFVALFARGLTDTGMASPAVAMYRYLLTAIATAGCLPLWRSIGRSFGTSTNRAALSRTQLDASWWALGSGAMMGFGWVAYVEALERVDVASVGVIYLTFPVFTMLTAWRLFGVQPHRRAVAGAVLVIVAAAFAIAPGSIDFGWPVLVAFAAPASFGLSIAVLTERLWSLGPMERLSLVSVGAVLGLVPLLARLPVQQIIPQSGRAWLEVIGIGIGTSLIPMSIYSFAAPVVGAARTAVIGGLELPTLFVIGVVFFDESISSAQLFAGFLILVAIVATPPRSAADLRRMALPSEELSPSPAELSSSVDLSSSGARPVERADSSHGIRSQPDRRTALDHSSGAKAPRPRS